MQLPLLESHPNCTLCDMYKSACSIGIATNWMPDSLEPSVSTDAIIIIGQNPGPKEDKDNANFIGKSGQYLRHTYIDGISMRTRASVYLANAARCGPESLKRAGPFNKCFPYLLQDIIAISRVHNSKKSKIVLLFVSAPAITAFYAGQKTQKVNQTESFNRQGEILTMCDAIAVFDPETKTVKDVTTREFDVAVFSTYHPSDIQNYHPNHILAVADHLDLVSKYLDNIPIKAPAPRIVPFVSPREVFGDSL